MGNYLNLGKYADEARALLDAIKGGAIRQMEIAFDALKATINSEWKTIKSKANSDVLAAIGRIDTDSVMSAIGFTAQNYNADFLDVVELGPNSFGHRNTWPKGFGIHKGFNNFVKTEVLHVNRVRNLNTDAEAIAFLEHIQAGTVISRSFNILKMTVLDANIPSGNVAIIPDGKVIKTPSASFLVHLKRKGSLTNWLGDIPNEGQWESVNRHYSSIKAGDYTNLDIGIGSASVGDVLYIALPTITAGHFPKTIKHGVLFNGKSDLTREMAK